MSARSSLVRDLRRRAAPKPAPERCDLCGNEIPPDHRHMLHVEERTIACTCEPCRALFAGDGPWRPTGTRVLVLDDLALPDELWARFRIPIGLAFFLVGRNGAVALYPSPAGATESELELEAWDELVRANPVLVTLEPEVEALVVDRIAEPARHALVPVDECYRLVGAIRVAWQGISGGPAVGAAIDGFFAGLEAR
jgi:hypothetical protein